MAPGQEGLAKGDQSRKWQSVEDATSDVQERELTPSINNKIPREQRSGSPGGKRFLTLSVRVSLPRSGPWRGKFVDAMAADSKIDMN